MYSQSHTLLIATGHTLRMLYLLTSLDFDLNDGPETSDVFHEKYASGCAGDVHLVTNNTAIITTLQRTPPSKVETKPGRSDVWFLSRKDFSMTSSISGLWMEERDGKK